MVRGEPTAAMMQNMQRCAFDNCVGILQKVHNMTQVEFGLRSYVLEGKQCLPPHVHIRIMEAAAHGLCAGLY